MPQDVYFRIDFENWDLDVIKASNEVEMANRAD